MGILPLGFEAVSWALGYGDGGWGPHRLQRRKRAPIGYAASRFLIRCKHLWRMPGPLQAPRS